MIRCIRCGGTKKIAPMGGIQVNCSVCQGIGMVAMNHTEIKPSEQLTPNIALANETMDIPVKVKNKGGRKKGWNKTPVLQANNPA